MKRFLFITGLAAVMVAGVFLFRPESYFNHTLRALQLVQKQDATRIVQAFGRDVVTEEEVVAFLEKIENTGWPVEYDPRNVDRSNLKTIAILSLVPSRNFREEFSVSLPVLIGTEKGRFEVYFDSRSRKATAVSVQSPEVFSPGSNQQTR